MLTAASIREVEPQRHAVEIADSPGLTLRVTPAGTRSWRVWYWHRGRVVRETVGRWPDIGIRAARAERDRVRARAAGEAEITLADFAAEYLESWSRPHKRSAGEDARVLEKDIIPEIGDRPVAQITRRECVRVVDRVQARGAPDMASRTHAVLRRVLQVAVERGIRDDNPASRIVAPQSGSRDRVLTGDELAAWGQALLTPGVAPAARIGLQLILATGQRPGEVLEMEWRDIDRTERVWEIPAAKAKNGRAHAVPLTGWALLLIREAEAYSGRHRVVAISADGLRGWMRSTVEAADIERATPHDLRRTVATWLGKLGYGRSIQDRLLNHIDQSTGAIYERYSYLEEQREALEHWSRRLQQIIDEPWRGTSDS